MMCHQADFRSLDGIGVILPPDTPNCEVENGSTRSSFNTTICVLEALLEYELVDVK